MGFWEDLGSTWSNFVNTWASIFGIDWIDRMAGKKRGDWDESTLNKVIDALYHKIEVSDTRLLNKLQQQMEGLLGVVTSPTTKNIINKWKKRLNERYNEAVKQQATHDFDKASMQHLASDISNLDAYDFDSHAGSKGNVLKQEFREKVRKVAGDDKEVQSKVREAQGWNKFKFNEPKEENQPQKQDVEERL